MTVIELTDGRVTKVETDSDPVIIVSKRRADELNVQEHTYQWPITRPDELFERYCDIVEQ